MKQYEEWMKEKGEARVKTILEDKDLSKKQRKTMQDFDMHCINTGKSLRTRMRYLQYLKTFAIETKKEFKEIKVEEFKKYLAFGRKKFSKEKEGKEISDSTLTDFKIGLMQFYKWLYKKDKEDIPLISWLEVKRLESDKLPDELLTTDEINKMSQLAHNFRDKAIITTLYETGSRKGEFLRLKIKHITFDAQGAVIIIPKGKTVGRRLRLINCVPDLLNWINNHPNRDDPNAPLWVTIGAWKGRAFGEDGIKRMIKILGQEAGIKKNIFPHLFRHSRATELTKLGFNEAKLRIFFGWTKKSAMPSKYIHLAGADIEQAILELHGDVEAVNKAKEESIKLQPKICPRCKQQNPSSALYCNCGMCLDDKERVNLMEMEDELRLFKQWKAKNKT